MKKPQGEYVSVWRLAETDGWDGVAAIGMHHCTYLHVKCVLLVEDGGWWDDSCQPYLVFTNVEFTDDEAAGAVERALESGELRCTLPGPAPDRERDPSRPTLCVDAPQRFDAVAEAGMRAGFSYSKVTYGADAPGTVALTFYNDEHDLPGDDDLDIDSVIDLL